VKNSPWWYCSGCGFANRPRHVANSLNLIPNNHELYDPEWRHSHCEQCGREYDSSVDKEYEP
jgi:ribosomal protein L37E